MTDPAPRWNPYAALDTDLPVGVSLSARMAVLEGRADLIEGLRAEIDEHEATIRDAKVRRDVAVSRLSIALHAADLLRDIEYSIAPLLGMANRAHLLTPAPAVSATPDGLSDLIGTLEPVTATPTVPVPTERPEEPAVPVIAAQEPEAQPELAPVPDPVTEMSEPAAQPAPEPVVITNTLDLVFPAGFELTTRAVVYLDVLAHPGATLAEIAARTDLLTATVGGVIRRGMTCLDFSRAGTPSQHTITEGGVRYLRQFHAYAVAQAEDEGASSEPSSEKPRSDEPETAAAVLESPEEPVAEAPAPAPEPEPVREAAPAKLVPGSAQARALDFLRAQGPATAPVIAAHLGMPPGPAGAVISHLTKAGHVIHTDTDPKLILIPGDTRPAAQLTKKAAEAPVAAEPDPVSGVSPLTQEDLKTRVRENAAQVYAVLGAKPMTELDLRAKLPDMQLSHLRAALGYLEEAGTVRRVPGPTPASRAAYARDTLELPAPTLDHLTAEGRMVEAHLVQVTDRSERDTVSNMSLKLGLPREEVEEALAVLHAQGRLRWSRTGMLLHFTLAPAQADEVAA